MHTRLLMSICIGYSSITSSKLCDLGKTNIPVPPFKVAFTELKLPFSSVQFSSVAQSCPTLCDPMNSSTPGLPVHHQLPEFTQTHIHQSVMPSSHLISVVPFSSCPQSLPASESFLVSQLFTWGCQSTGVSTWASFLPKNTQGWSPLEWPGYPLESIESIYIILKNV